jgi:hypothetical protein
MCDYSLRSNAQAHSVFGQLIERTDLHGDQSGMAIVRIEHADPNADPARGGSARCGRGQHATIEGVLGKPDRMKPTRLGGLGELDAALWIEAAMQTNTQLRHLHDADPRGTIP